MPWQLVTQLMINVVVILGRAVLSMRVLSGQILPPDLMSPWQLNTFHFNFWIIEIIFSLASTCVIAGVVV